MMTKFLANVALLVAGVGLQLANYWFTFGLWPQSWWSFTLCSVGYVLLIGARLAVEKDEKKIGPG